MAKRSRNIVKYRGIPEFLSNGSNSKVLSIGARWSHSISLSVGKNGPGSRFTADQSQFVTGRRYETTRFDPRLFSIFHLFVIKLQSIRLSPCTRNREKQCMHAPRTPPPPSKVITFLLRPPGNGIGDVLQASRSIYALLARVQHFPPCPRNSSNSFFAAGVHRNENQVCKLIRRFQIYRLFLFFVFFFFYSRFLRLVKRRKLDSNNGNE